MTNKSSSGFPGVKIPKAEGMIPRRREGELAVRRNHYIGNKVVMSVQDAFGISISFI
jgi:hypothetical protein